MSNNLPIGVFDSGVGGLTVVKDLIELLPQESIIYFGDTLHLPYGDKPKPVVESYVQRIVDFLLAQEVKLILVACNSATAAACDLLQQSAEEHGILLVNVVDPMIELLSQQYNGKSVGLIGTKLTVESGIYASKLEQQKTLVQLTTLATPLLAPLIEASIVEQHSLDTILEEYLAHPSFNDICALVLGCTHYPWIKNKIERFYQGKVEVIDASQITALAVRELLAERDLLAEQEPYRHFYLSNLTMSFLQKAHKFLGTQEAQIEERNIF